MGPTEALLIGGLFLLLFGADKLPDLAREVGRVSARLRGASKQFQDQLDRERGEVSEAFVPGDAVPRDAMQAAQAHEQRELNEFARVQKAAQALGIDILGKNEEQLRSEIAARVASAGSSSPAA